MSNLPDPETCFKQGIDARAAGRGRAENPYDLTTIEHREWAAGWAATCDLDEDDDPHSSRVKSGDLDLDEEPESRPRRRPLSG